MYCRWMPLICGALVISVVIENWVLMCLVAFAWGIIWGNIFKSYIVPLVEKSYYKEKTKEDGDESD